MLLLLLTRILLWAAVGLIIWFILLRFIPRPYLTWFGGLVVLALLVVSFVDTSSPAIGTIWRILSFPLYPLGAAISLLGVAVSQGVKKVNGNQVAWALAILFFASLPLVGRYLVGQSEGSVQAAFTARQTLCEDVCPAEIPTQAANLSSVLAVVVMGDSVDTVGQSAASPTQVDSSRAFNVSFEPRLIYSSILYNQLRSRGGTPQMYVTAGSTLGTEEEQNNKKKSIKQVLANNAVPTSPQTAADDVVRIINTGMAARSTAEQVKQSLADQQLLTDDPRPQDNRIMLVAPALTIRRAALAFEHLNLQVIARPTDFYSKGGQRSGDLLVRLSDVVPSIDGLRLTTRYWNELLTTVYYFLRGWLPPFNVSWESVVEI